MTDEVWTVNSVALVSGVSVDGVAIAKPEISGSLTLKGLPVDIPLRSSHFFPMCFSTGRLLCVAVGGVAAAGSNIFGINDC